MKRLILFLALAALVVPAAGCGDDDGTSPVDSPINGEWRTDEFEAEGVRYVLEMDLTLQDDGSLKGDGSITVRDEDGEAVLDLRVDNGDYDPPALDVVLEFEDSRFVSLIVRGDYTGGDVINAALQNAGFENTPITFRRVG